jgi:hypothetical protein
MYIVRFVINTSINQLIKVVRFYKRSILHLNPFSSLQDVTSNIGTTFERRTVELYKRKQYTARRISLKGSLEFHPLHESRYVTLCKGKLTEEKSCV